MIGIYSLIGSGILIRSRSELRMLIRSYYLILSIVLVVGLVRIFVLIFCMAYFSIAKILELTIILTFYPIAMLIPIHFINLYNIFPSFPMNQDILSKRKSLIRISIMIIYTIVIGIIYLVISYGCITFNFSPGRAFLSL